jgi:hypothetical protein
VVENNGGSRCFGDDIIVSCPALKLLVALPHQPLRSLVTNQQEANLPASRRIAHTTTTHTTTTHIGIRLTAIGREHLDRVEPGIQAGR